MAARERTRARRRAGTRPRRRSWTTRRRARARQRPPPARRPSSRAPAPIVATCVSASTVTPVIRRVVTTTPDVTASVRAVTGGQHGQREALDRRPSGRPRPRPACSRRRPRRRACGRRPGCGRATSSANPGSPRDSTGPTTRADSGCIGMSRPWHRPPTAAGRPGASGGPSGLDRARPGSTRPYRFVRSVGLERHPPHVRRRMEGMTTVPRLTLNNGVEIPQLGFGVFQIPPEETKDAVLQALRRGLPAHRHRAELPQRAGCRRCAGRVGSGPRGGVRHHQAEQRRARPGRRARGLRPLAGAPGHRPRRPVPHPLAARDAERLRRDLEGARGHLRLGPREGGRRVQLPARAPAPPAGRDDDRARGEPDRGRTLT